MRITARQHHAIIEASREIFGDAAQVRLFGSRADDAARGGDIDLHVQLFAVDPHAIAHARQFVARICAKLGDILPIDVVVQDAASEDALIYQEGMRGVRL
ncbi:MAG: nucleotidyltransferase domain-containing protein [Gallionella sp.]